MIVMKEVAGVATNSEMTEAIESEFLNDEWFDAVATDQYGNQKDVKMTTIESVDANEYPQNLDMLSSVVESFDTLAGFTGLQVIPAELKVEPDGSVSIVMDAKTYEFMQEKLGSKAPGEPVVSNEGTVVMKEVAGIPTNSQVTGAIHGELRDDEWSDSSAENKYGHEKDIKITTIDGVNTYENPDDLALLRNVGDSLDTLTEFTKGSIVPTSFNVMDDGTVTMTMDAKTYEFMQEKLGIPVSEADFKMTINGQQLDCYVDPQGAAEPEAQIEMSGQKLDCFIPDM